MQCVYTSIINNLRAPLLRAIFYAPTIAMRAPYIINSDARIPCIEVADGTIITAIISIPGLQPSLLGQQMCNAGLPILIGQPHTHTPKTPSTL